MPEPVAPRSGDTVLTAAERLVPLLALLSPWIDGTVAWLQAHLTYTTLGSGYSEVVQGAIVAYLPVLLGRWRMRQIRAGAAPPADLDGGSHGAP